jgi:hypothetical protein
MTLTEDGAMKDDDLKILRSGTLQLLPSDSQGRHVLFFNVSSCKHPKDDRLLRCMFYMFHHAGNKMEENRVTDIIMLCNYKVRLEKLDYILAVLIGFLTYCLIVF